jgi:glutamine amidotransferase
MCFETPMAANISIHEFATRGHDNPDGWGLAWYPDRSAAVVKEAIAWQSSKHTVFLESYPDLRSAIYLGHVRHKTVGGPVTHADTHPFCRELGGAEYCFAHNGTLMNLAEAFPLSRFRPIGLTDSEHVFCHLLDAIADECGDLRTEASWRWLHARLLAMNAHGKMNVLLSDGLSLFCYHDLRGHKGLHWRRLPALANEPKRLEDEELQIDLEAAAANRGVVVATCPLSGGGWNPFVPGQLLVLRKGVAKYHRRSPKAASQRARA